MIGKKNINNFANLLAKLPNLTRINMKKNFINDKSMSIISLPMSKLTKLKWLDLDKNMLNYLGQYILAQLIPNLSQNLSLFVRHQCGDYYVYCEDLWKPLIKNNDSIYI
jgi:Ran GTPase-activating protein (RanGAP) involved in mRNA processing and transport